MSQLPYLLPWVRVALLIRSILSTPFDETAWPTRQDGIGPSPHDAEPTRAGGLVELRGLALRGHAGVLELLAYGMKAGIWYERKSWPRPDRRRHVPRP